jgi:hypothetical protein
LVAEHLQPQAEVEDWQVEAHPQLELLQESLHPPQTL